jgi:hypothetical protein
MTKRLGKPKGRNRKERREWPFVVYLWAMGLGLTGYLIVGRFILATRPHPYHWERVYWGPPWVLVWAGCGIAGGATSFRGAAGRIQLRSCQMRD